MELSSFAKLEEQINRAISHIEKLTAETVRLETENQDLKTRITKLEHELKTKHEMLMHVEQESSRMAEAAREKIESILHRIDGFEKGSA